MNVNEHIDQEINTKRALYVRLYGMLYNRELGHDKS
jgi:hypothetical protein